MTQNAIIKKEWEFLQKIKDNPNDLNLLSQGLNDNVITGTAKSRKLRYLYDVIQKGSTLAVYYNHKTGKWENDMPYSRHSHSHRVTSHSNSKWKKYIDYGDKKLKTTKEYKVQRNLLYGIELELVDKGIGSSDSAARMNRVTRDQGSTFLEVINLLGGKEECAVKHDGSINGGADGLGFEVVTSPAPFKVIHDNLSALLSAPITNRVESNSSCGIHIHVSRDPLRDRDINKLLYFINHPDNCDFIKKIGKRRGETNYCKFKWDSIKDIKGFKKDTHAENIARISNWHRGTDHREPFTDHFSALSLSRNNPTLEFRIFGGSVDKRQVLADLEFVDALCSWSRQSSLAEYHHKDFLVWLFDGNNTRWRTADRKPESFTPRQEYPNLVSLVTEYGYNPKLT